MFFQKLLFSAVLVNYNYIVLQRPVKELSEQEEKKSDQKKDNKNMAFGSLDTNPKQILKEQLEWVTQGRCERLAWRGAEVREHFRLLWKQDGTFLKKIFPLFDVEVQVSPVFS